MQCCRITSIFLPILTFWILHISLFATSIAPWLTVAHGLQAVLFYQTAFGAVETYRMEGPDCGLIVKLSVNGAEFLVSSGAEQNKAGQSSLLGGDTIQFNLRKRQKIIFQKKFEGKHETYGAH